MDFAECIYLIVAPFPCNDFEPDCQHKLETFDVHSICQGKQVERRKLFLNYFPAKTQPSIRLHLMTTIDHV